jgi:hypothetical protein
MEDSSEGIVPEMVIPDSGQAHLGYLEPAL